jgi:hypothetical protein
MPGQSLGGRTRGFSGKDGLRSGAGYAERALATTRAAASGTASAAGRSRRGCHDDAEMEERRLEVCVAAYLRGLRPART